MLRGRMNYINNFHLFESRKLNEYDSIMGKLLHLYGSISLEKEKASIIINKIVLNSRGKYFRLGEDVNIRHEADHDKVRFKDYFDSLLKSKDSRGHNFEGTIAGLYGGDLSQRGEKWDITIEEKTWSVKFVDNSSKAPEIGSFNKSIIDASKLNYPNLENDIIEMGGLTTLFRSDNKELKNKVFEVISNGITGGWILSYPEKSKHGRNFKIVMNIVPVDVMRDLFVNKKMSVAPKAGIKSKFTLALSSKYKKEPSVITSSIRIPILTLSELKSIAYSDKELQWSIDVFGKYGPKIRTDVLRHIKNNADDISDRLKRFKDFKL
jgi:hypothetical protein